MSTFLLRQVGEKIARDLLLTGRLFDSEEAKRIGLINEIVAAETLLERARELAALLLKNSPASLRYTKRLLSDAARTDMDMQIETAVREMPRYEQRLTFARVSLLFLKNGNRAGAASEHEQRASHGE